MAKSHYQFKKRQKELAKKKKQEEKRKRRMEKKGIETDKIEEDLNSSIENQESS